MSTTVSHSGGDDIAAANGSDADALRRDLLREEFANSVTHGFGLMLSLAGAATMMTLADWEGERWVGLACGIYGATLVGVYGASTLSHAIQHPRLKRLFQIWDQGLIYLLIAGSFTPFALAYLSSGQWWILLGLMWSVALLGFLSKILLEHRIEAVSVSACVLLGWLPAFAIPQMLRVVPRGAFNLMIIGGLCYTFGTFFLVADRRFRYAHAVWHLFVIAGSSCHYALILVFIVLQNS